MPKNQIQALFPRTRLALLGRLLFDPERSWYLSELAESIGLSGPDIRRELTQLAQADIINEWRDGNRVYFSANTQCPFFPELRGLLLKTSGLVDVVRNSLATLTKQIRLAFVYGSISRGDEVSGSDVDLLIVGEVTPKDLAKKLTEAEQTLQRDVNTNTYTLAEFKKKAQQGDHFVGSVLAGEKIFVVGSEDELAAIIETEGD
jgi:predicted nucleotidyltransferase